MPFTEPQVFPRLEPGEPSFFTTVSAHSDARFVPGNRVDILLNGDQTFPPILRAIRNARRSITFAQYFYAKGPIADDIAHALAERCLHGVKVHVLLDSFGASGIPGELVSDMKSSGCEVEWFRRIKLLQFLTPWEVFAHTTIAIIAGSSSWMGCSDSPAALG
jgi:cardiolipin synthase